MKTTTPRPAMVPMPVNPFKVDWHLFDRMELTSTRPNTAIGESKIDMSGRKHGNIAPLLDEEINLQILIQQWHGRSTREHFRVLASSLTEEHPSISTDPGIFGGMPHIKNLRLSVGDVLAKLYVYGSIQAILDDYSPDVNENQIKEAIAYAQDFLEAACDPRQSR